VDLSHFPTDERFAQIPGKLVLTDNLDEDWNENEEPQHPGFPVQVTMAVDIICQSGEMDIDIDLNHYRLTGGHAALILPGSFVQMKHVAHGTRCVFMAISADFIKFVSDVKTSIEFGRIMRERPVHHLPPHALEESLNIYRQLKNKLTREDYHFKETVAKAYLQILQCNVFQAFTQELKQEKESRSFSRKEELFMQFMAAVKEHYITHRNISHYANLLCVSPKYLSSVVHAASGKYATEWINQYVILEAKTMLKSEGSSIKDISNKLHFANQSFFAKFFKQHTGYTPKEYKEL
jgi:AraC-like DNA-binding protein